MYHACEQETVMESSKTKGRKRHLTGLTIPEAGSAVGYATRPSAPAYLGTQWLQAGWR